jgi:succinoglycan biosynthesis protein ExoL
MQLANALPGGMAAGVRQGPRFARFFRMTRIAFFGHDAADAAVRRRVQGFRDDGLDVVGFTMRRRDDVVTDWQNIDLGRTFDGAYRQRIESIFRGAKLAAAERDLLASADVIYARNLDMLITAFLAKRHTGLKTPVIYEALDVHRLLTRKDLIGLMLRRAEGALLRRTRRLVVSSPGFLENYFEVRHRGQYRETLIENRLAAGAAYGPRPGRDAPVRSAAEPLRLGWVGMLRCNRSLGLLVDLARQLGPKVQIVLHGTPALKEIPDFHERIQGLPNVEFHGRYKAPEDLARIYGGLDLVWAGDFMEAGYNSVWLLPNRLYEGGYYAVPPIAPEGTQTAKWINTRDVGFTVSEDLACTLPGLLRSLIANRGTIAVKRSHLLDLPDSTFVAARGELAALISDTLRNSPEPRIHLDQANTRHARKAAG